MARVILNCEGVGLVMRELGRGSTRAGLELIDFLKFKSLHKILHGHSAESYRKDRGEVTGAINCFWKPLAMIVPAAAYLWLRSATSFAHICSSSRMVCACFSKIAARYAAHCWSVHCESGLDAATVFS
jgi:hypothetical protein